MTELKTWAQRAGTHLTNLQNAFDAADAQRHLSALQGQLERLGLHVVNLQNEVNAIRDNSRAWADPFRGVERQVEQAGLRINHLEFEIGKNQTETRFAQRTLEQMASRRSSLEQQLSRVDERQAEDAAFIKAIVAEHAALLQRFVADDSAVLQQ
jgi:chromosome segregation ATPase